ncbi:MAG: tRNA uridine-5-carboxymethylaminomethyl(34) synthesis enzyme MnmG [Bacteroidia bacterium]
MKDRTEYDVIVVGGGHAGCEAAAAAGNLGSRVLLVTMNMNTIAQMSCNPAMGGIAKGQILREIDALGGYSGIVADKTTLQFRMLNKSKGPAMWSPRSQNDRMRFAEEWRKTLESIPNVDFWQEMVEGLIVKNDKVIGVRTQLGLEFKAKAVVLTNGTFLNGVIHIGEKNFGGGRAGERASTGITGQLRELGFENGRMKTGTPPRIDGRSLDYTKMERQEGDVSNARFSYLPIDWPDKQLVCHITYTNEQVHDVLRTGFERSPMFSGRIDGTGPRYCPSIEDKVNRFAERDRHQIFVEPEGWNTVEVYVNGFSTSLPEDVQRSAIKLIPGFENAKLFRPGYAIEYDYFPPLQLSHTLQTKLIENLFFAGQINGTTGYEEAAGQGLMAGINAHNKVHGASEFTLNRSQAYIGVLIDDLINKGTDEPYRMFTSRAEYRILLRQDNADLRLTPLSYNMGLAGKARYERVMEKKDGIESIIDFITNNSGEVKEMNSFLSGMGETPLSQKVRYKNVLSRPGITLNLMRQAISGIEEFLSGYDEEIVQGAEIQIKYEGYIAKEQDLVDKMIRLENIRLPRIDYSTIGSLSSEAREKLNSVKPETLGQASRVSGVSPADVSVLMVYVGR